MLLANETSRAYDRLTTEGKEPQTMLNPRRTVLVGLVAAGVAGSTAAVAMFPADLDARTRKCTRGADLVAASESVRIVRIDLKPDFPLSRYDKLLGCRTTNGRRFTLLYESEVPDESHTKTEFTIVGDRYIGAISRFSGAVKDGASAMLWDSLKRRRIHSSHRNCDPSGTGGNLEAVFSVHGAIAYRCGQAGLVIADAQGELQLEAAGTDARDLAFSRTRLYWLVDGPTGEQLKSFAR